MFSAKAPLKAGFLVLLVLVSPPQLRQWKTIFLKWENKSNIFSISSGFSFFEFIPLSRHMLPLAWKFQEKRMVFSVKTASYSAYCISFCIQVSQLCYAVIFVTVLRASPKSWNRAIMWNLWLTNLLKLINKSLSWRKKAWSALACPAASTKWNESKWCAIVLI